MNIVIEKNFCEVCGEEFDAVFIRHERPEDDFQFENEEEYLFRMKELGFPEIYLKIYPHLHAQPTTKCCICPDCRMEVVKIE